MIIESHLNVGDVAKGTEGVKQDLLVHAWGQVAHVQSGDGLRQRVRGPLRHEQLRGGCQHGACGHSWSVCTQ